MTRRRRPPDRYSWFWRRVVIAATLGLCGWGLVYLTVAGADTRLNETLAQIFGALAGATVGSYVFGAVWHDRGVMQQAADTGVPPYGATDAENNNGRDGA